MIAKRNQQSSELQFRESAVQTIAAVKQAYWTLKATRANVTVQQRSLQLAEELARQTKIRVDAGQIPPLDLVQAEAEVAQRRENLIRANTGDGDAEDRLRRLIMDAADASFWRAHLDPIEEPMGRGELPDIDAVVEKALGQRLDVSRANLELENAKATVEFLDNQRLPDVRLETSYRGNGLAGSQFIRSGGFPGVITGARTRGFGDALGQAFGPDYPAWSVGVTVNYPLGRSFEEASRARADVERRQDGAANLEPAAGSGRNDPAGGPRDPEHRRTHRRRACGRDPRGAAGRSRTAPLRRRPVDDVSRHAGAARPAAGTGEPASNDA